MKAVEPEEIAALEGVESDEKSSKESRGFFFMHDRWSISARPVSISMEPSSPKILIVW